MKLEQKLVLRQDVIVGFSYSFCSNLLKKLEELLKTDNVFNCGVKEAEKMESRGSGYLQYSETTSIARTVLLYLLEQVKYEEIAHLGGDRVAPSEVKRLIEHSKEFLKIFS